MERVERHPRGPSDLGWRHLFVEMFLDEPLCLQNP